MHSSPIPIDKGEREQQRKIDRFGELSRQIDEFAPVVAEHKVLKDDIQKLFEGKAADQSHTAEGKLYTVQLFPCERERTVTNPKKAFALLKKYAGGMNGALALITIPLGAAIDKFIPKTEHGVFIVEERTGSRKLKVVPKASPAPVLPKAA